MHPKITTIEGRHRRVKAGHPWLYSNEVAMTAATKAIPPGTVVEVTDSRGAPLGTASFNPHTLFAGRMLGPAGIAVDADFLATRLEAALALRSRLYDEPYYRLVHAEADGLPGLVADRFGDLVVLQLNTAGMERLRAPLLAALDRVLAPRTVVLRNDSTARTLEGLDLGTETVKGEQGGRIELRENGAVFMAEPWTGQKTGWFFDQRDNRAFLARLAPGLSVLDVYSYGGGFGVLAAVAGAREVTIVDRSAGALDLAAAAAAANGVAARCRFERQDALADLERRGQRGERHDLVIVDPPSFVKSKKDLQAGARGYRKMTRLAAALVTPGGFLFAASCSHNMTTELFFEQVTRGLVDAGRTGRVLRSAGAGPDHPVHPALPESAYLKSLTLQLD